MKGKFILLSALIVACSIFALAFGLIDAPAVPSNNLKNGDIIFQTSLSSQSKAIQLATGSEYSHMGVIYIEDGLPFVYEAIQAVQLTPFNKWIARGQNKHYVVKRLKNSENILTEDVLVKMRTIGNKFKNKNYDLYFEWSDDRIYCSELVWKIYFEATGISIGTLQELQDFDLSSPQVKQKLKERYGDKIPLQEKVISPASMFSSDVLMTVR